MPASIPWRAIGAAATAAAFFTAGWLTNGWRKDAELAELRSGWDRERANQAQAQGAAINAARTEEQRRTAAQTEIANVATRESETARADARAASALADQLRARVAELARRPSAGAGDPAAAGGGETAGDPLGVLANVLSRADRRAGVLAEYADAARVAGRACERAYGALKPESD